MRSGMSSNQILNHAYDVLVSHGYVVRPRYSVATKEELASVLEDLTRVAPGAVTVEQEDGAVVVRLEGLGIEAGGQLA